MKLKIVLKIRSELDKLLVCSPFLLFRSGTVPFSLLALNSVVTLDSGLLVGIRFSYHKILEF